MLHIGVDVFQTELDYVAMTDDAPAPIDGMMVSGFGPDEDSAIDDLIRIIKFKTGQDVAVQLLILVNEGETVKYAYKLEVSE